ILILGYLGAQTADDTNVVLPWVGVELPIGKLLLARLCTFYYFVHFLILMPLLGLIETPLPVPESISKAVLAKNGKAQGAPVAKAAEKGNEDPQEDGRCSHCRGRHHRRRRCRVGRRRCQAPRAAEVVLGRAVRQVRPHAAATRLSGLQRGLLGV